MSAVEDLLGEFLEVCGRLDDNYDVDRQTFDSDELRRLATQQLWIDLGETARRYCLPSGLGSNAEPWSDVIRHRDKLAHLLRTEVNVQLLWNARREIASLRAAAKAALGT